MKFQLDFSHVLGCDRGCGEFGHVHMSDRRRQGVRRWAISITHFCRVSENCNETCGTWRFEHFQDQKILVEKCCSFERELQVSWCDQLSENTNNYLHRRLMFWYFKTNAAFIGNSWEVLNLTIHIIIISYHIISYHNHINVGFFSRYHTVHAGNCDTAFWSSLCHDYVRQIQRTGKKGMKSGNVQSCGCIMMTDTLRALCCRHCFVWKPI